MQHRIWILAQQDFQIVRPHARMAVIGTSTDSCMQATDQSSLYFRSYTATLRVSMRGLKQFYITYIILNVSTINKRTINCSRPLALIIQRRCGLKRSGIIFQRRKWGGVCVIFGYQAREMVFLCEDRSAIKRVTNSSKISITVTTEIQMHTPMICAQKCNSTRKTSGPSSSRTCEHNSSPINFKH